eukprot:CAMPEP_0170477644 /NCGR_PEP_ID=MMETSP0123-20130129/18857_1 /TAXON_ID=182087 /ORGANISM="Favella ehrenbergii, Strain Fehren 1" /LENGTH=169 /DNA_ID=CAMNT_0010749485 /DNA_START=1694 /DNA_END=2203 /DNA_ORIENTATION=+
MVAAFECYKKAAELGCVKSTTKLGHMYYSGVKKQTLADDPPSADSEQFLASMTYQTQQENLSTEEELPLSNEHYYVTRQEALKMYYRAGKKGDSEACNCAALIIERENPVEAVDLYKRALELNERNTEAMFNMALLYYNKRDEREWHLEAVKMMRRAALLGNSQAIEYL